MLGRHFVGVDPLPEIARLRLAGGDRRAAFAAGQGRLLPAQIELSLRLRPAVAFQAPAGQNRCDLLVKVRRVRKGLDRADCQTDGNECNPKLHCRDRLAAKPNGSPHALATKIRLSPDAWRQATPGPFEDI